MQDVFYILIITLLLKVLLGSNSLRRYFHSVPFLHHQLDLLPQQASRLIEALNESCLLAEYRFAHR